MSDALYDMSDEELETAFRDAKMNMDSGEEISTEDFEAVVDETAVPGMIWKTLITLKIPI